MIFNSNQVKSECVFSFFAKDGRLLYVTPMDPLYLLLPYLVKAGKEVIFSLFIMTQSGIIKWILPLKVFCSVMSRITTSLSIECGVDDCEWCHNLGLSLHLECWYDVLSLWHHCCFRHFSLPSTMTSSFRCSCSHCDAINLSVSPGEVPTHESDGHGWGFPSMHQAAELHTLPGLRASHSRGERSEVVLLNLYWKLQSHTSS